MINLYYYGDIIVWLDRDRGQECYPPAAAGASVALGSASVEQFQSRW